MDPPEVLCQVSDDASRRCSSIQPNFDALTRKRVNEASKERQREQQVEPSSEAEGKKAKQGNTKTCHTGTEAHEITPAFSIDHDPCPNRASNRNETQQANEASAWADQAKEPVDVTTPDGKLKWRRKVVIHELLRCHASIVSAPRQRGVH